MDAITFEIRSSVVKAIEIELKIVRVKTEQEEALAGILRQEAKYRVHHKLL